MSAAVKVALPESFVAEVAAARLELAEVAPRMLALVDRYEQLEAEFNQLVPHPSQYETEEHWCPPWADCGGEQLMDRVYELLEQLAERLHRRLG